MITQQTLKTGTEGQVVLALQMTHRHDRFAAELQWSSDHTSWVPILRSVEGDDRRLWPPSPTIQQLSRQENEAGEFLAGVGMAGNSHWSLSTIVIHGEIPTLEFDVACRVKADPEWLGSTYQILNGQPIESEVEACIVVGDHVIQVEPVANVGACDVNIENNRLCVAARQLDGPLPRTVRWTYRITLVKERGRDTTVGNGM